MKPATHPGLSSRIQQIEKAEEISKEVDQTCAQLYRDFPAFEQEAKNNKELEIRFNKFEAWQRMMQNPESAKQFVTFDKIYSEFIVNGGTPIFKWMMEHGNILYKMNLAKIEKEIVEFVSKNPHLALEKNLERIKFAMDNPAIAKPEVLESLDRIKNATVKIEISRMV